MQEKETFKKKLEKELALYKDKLLDCTKQIENFEMVLTEKMQHLSSLQNALKMKESEISQAGQLLEKTKALNSENYDEFQLQIESVNLFYFIFVLISLLRTEKLTALIGKSYFVSSKLLLAA